MRVRSGLLVLWAALVATLAYAQGPDTSVLKLPQDIEFKGPLTGAPQTAVLYGDPKQTRGVRHASKVLGRLERYAALASR